MACASILHQQIVDKNGGSGGDSGAEVLHRLIQGIRAAHPENVLMCEHWDDRTNASTLG